MPPVITAITPTDTQLKQIQQLQARLSAEPDNCGVLLQLAQCYVTAATTDLALNCFQRFMHLMAHQLGYLAPFCQLLHQHGYSAQAAQLYGDYCSRYPARASLFYNHAFYLRFAGDYQQAISQYRQALNLNISQPEEVWLNIAVIYSDHLRQEDSAEQALSQALQLKADYVPALYNLANLAEQRGDKPQAEVLFKRVVEVDPRYQQASARLADVMTFKDEDDPVIKQMQHAVHAGDTGLSTKINLHFALGKAFDDCGLFKQAWDHFRQANQLNSTTMPAYNPAFFAQHIQQIIQTFDRRWLNTYTLANDARPVFICGMFRSGSTLAEQILAQHPHVTAGGEIDFFCRQLKDIYPQQLAQAAVADLAQLAQRYLQYCQQCFPAATLLTDKRPDNYLYLGLLKALFPRAKFVFTRRHKIDNCLSVYFLRLGSAMSYANKLEHCLHYYEQHEKLMAHWQQLFGRDIFTLDYDQLVTEPETTLQPLLTFLGLEYQPQLLDFHQAKNPVKTASVWQVRQPLYQHASGRRHHYAALLPEIAVT